MLDRVSLGVGVGRFSIMNGVLVGQLLTVGEYTNLSVWFPPEADVAADFSGLHR